MRGLGTTSACAENTPRTGVRSSNPGNYLRVRGEYFTALMRCRSTSELPPRARRILHFAYLFGGVYGTTSACAENTHPQRNGAVGVGNYLRVRGEYPTRPRRSAHHLELPPRARRIRPSSRGIIINIGTTSACAENTLGWSWADAFLGNYLRVRGEYSRLLPPSRRTGELPPRARRIRVRKHNSQPVSGTTSACAENTAWYNIPLKIVWNYLRVRGEYDKATSKAISVAELPPRARRIRNRRVLDRPPVGTTSACAENTSVLSVWQWCPRNYLRVRGEYLLQGSYRKYRSELPPRARRIHGERVVNHWGTGTTSACAENTWKTNIFVSSAWNYLRVRGEYVIMV